MGLPKLIKPIVGDMSMIERRMKLYRAIGELKNVGFVDGGTVEDYKRQIKILNLKIQEERERIYRLPIINE